MRWVLLLVVLLSGCIDGSQTTSSQFQPGYVAPDQANGDSGANQAPGGDGTADGSSSNSTTGGGSASQQNQTSGSGDPGAGAQASQEAHAETRVGPRIVVDKWQGTLMCSVGTLTIAFAGCYAFSGGHSKHYPLDENITWVQSVLDYQKAPTTLGELRMTHRGPGGYTGDVAGPPRAHLGTPGSELTATTYTYGPQGTVTGQKNITELRIGVWADWDIVNVVYDQDFCIETWFIYGERPPTGWTIDDGEWW